MNYDDVYDDMIYDDYYYDDYGITFPPENISHYMFQDFQDPFSPIYPENQTSDESDESISENYSEESKESDESGRNSISSEIEDDDSMLNSTSEDPNLFQEPTIVQMETEKSETFSVEPENFEATGTNLPNVKTTSCCVSNLTMNDNRIVGGRESRMGEFPWQVNEPL